MNKLLIISVILIPVGISCFAVAGYFYWTLNQLFETLAYYGLQEQSNSNPKTAATVFDLKFGVVKFSILGAAAWILSIIFFLKRKTL